ncbi:protein translocase subunit SecF [Candidatus Gracilibacteria bacterium]|nr:protein translocase subunit SecF [Candidatus Gracilibacteria bacterium]
MKPRFSIIKRAPYWILLGACLLVVAHFLFFKNVQLSEEFTGGINIGISTNVEEQNLDSSIRTYLDSINYKDAKIFIDTQDIGTKIKINTQIESDDKVAELSRNIQNLLIEQKYISSDEEIIEQSIIGPSVGSYMQKTARSAVLVGLVFMAIYMLISFSVIRKVISPGILASITILTMIFDISIPAGAYGLRMMFDPTIQVDTVFIIAILTTMGYSINDTIIIFDRIRENFQNKGGTKDIVYGKIFEQSLRQTMRRSFGTVLSTLLVIVAMYIFGTGDIKEFAFTIGIGVIAGSYSSIFISAPLAYLIMGKYKKEKNKL